MLSVIGLVADSNLVQLAFRYAVKDFPRREPTVRQTRPLAAELVIMSLAFFVDPLSGIVVGSFERLPLILLSARRSSSTEPTSRR